MNTSEMIQPHEREVPVSGSQTFGIGSVTGWRILDSHVRVEGEKGHVAFQFVNECIVRVVHTRGMGDTDWSSTPAVMEMKNVKHSPNVLETSDQLSINAGKLKVAIDKKDGQFKIGLVLVEPTNRFTGLISDKRMNWNVKGGLTCSGRLSPTSKIYGLGETTGFLNKRGEKYVFWNSDIFDPHVPGMESLYQSVPFLIHFDQGSAYGEFIDYPGKLTVDMRSEEDRYSFIMESDRLDQYVIMGPTLKEVVAGYTALTGTTPLPPQWAIGYHQSRYSYKTYEEVLTIARTFREKGIPLDAIYLDIHFMDGFRVFTFHPERFPEPQEMISELSSMGIHVVPIVDPGVKRDPKYSLYQEGVRDRRFCRKLEGDVFFGKVWPGESAFPDFTDPSVREWWGLKHQAYTDLGIKGIWNDMNEPSVFDCELKTMDLDVILDNDGNPKTHEELHNLYGFQMSRATQVGLKNLLEGERPFVVTRAGYAGIQRYAAVWTGDNRSFWEHLAMSIPMMMNLGLSGVAFTGADIGGFGHHAGGELLARWTQLGVFTPFCRNHCLDNMTYQEPWRFGERIEEICRKYIELRYRWMPHLYTLFREASVSGLPIVRPLVLEYPDDEETHLLCDQFLLGKDVLVAPMYRPDMVSRSIYLPRGQWYDYWTGERFEGERHVLANAPLETLPLYVRAGAVVPERQVRQYAGDIDRYDSDQLTFFIYPAAPGESSLYELYEDDAKTFNYEKGEYNLLRLEVMFGEKEIRFNFGYSWQEWDVRRGTVRIIIRGNSQQPKGIQDDNGKGILFHYDDINNELMFEYELFAQDMNELVVRY